VARKRLGIVERRASVLDCGGPPPLCVSWFAGEKRRRAAAIQNLAEFPAQPSKPATVFMEMLKMWLILIAFGDHSGF